MKNIAVIFAGGVGKRMGSKIPKQFLDIYGKPIIVHTIEKFQFNSNIDEIYIACKEEYIDLLKDYISKYNITKVDYENIISGGRTGLETIHKLLKKVKADNDEDVVVLIHDGVRPIINDEVIEKNINGVLEHGNAITCVSLFETPIISEDGTKIDLVLDRKKVYVAKAPQSFKLNEILECYDILSKESETFEIEGLVDSCSVALKNNMKLNMIEGNRDNIKVTTAEDYMEILGKLIASDYNNFFNLETGNYGKNVTKDSGKKLVKIRTVNDNRRNNE